MNLPRKSYIAFFDLDNTIISGNTGKLLVLSAYKRGLLSLFHLMEGVLLSAFHKYNIVSSEFVINRMARWLQGKTENSIIQLSEEIFNISIKSKIRIEIQSELDTHREKGALLVILSAATKYICLPVESYLKMDHSIYSEMEVNNGIFTGFPVGSYCYGEVKAEKIKDFCKSNSYTSKEAFYYGDSYADLAALKSVNNPVCVYPDKKLRDYAIKKKWRIID